jgi:hypothetical protein
LSQAKLRSFRLAPKYKCGFEIQQDHKEHAVELDEEGGTTQWVDATSLEMVQLNNYDCFHDQGKGVDIPKGLQEYSSSSHLLCQAQWKTQGATCS